VREIGAAESSGVSRVFRGCQQPREGNKGEWRVAKGRIRKRGEGGGRKE